MNELSWLGVLRHGQSAGNVAAERAEATGAEIVGVDTPDPLTELTDLGRDQARAAGDRFAAQPPERRPELLISSTYRRAVDTAHLVADAMVPPPPVRSDERLRDRELGILDRLTGFGVAQRFPDEDLRRRFLGKFYYRPPGGESWADVTLRLRSFLSDVRREHADARVLLVGHEAIVMLLRYLIEDLSVDDVLDLARRPLLNAGLTSWSRDGSRLTLATFDDDALVRSGSELTRQPHA